VDDARQFNQALLLQTSELIKVANELSSVAEKMALMGDVVRELQVHQLSQAPPQPQLPGRRR
jgi:hypothetical protein